MPSIRQIWPDTLPSAKAVQQLLSALRPERPVRPVVTPGGHLPTLSRAMPSHAWADAVIESAPLRVAALYRQAVRRAARARSTPYGH